MTDENEIYYLSPSAVAKSFSAAAASYDSVAVLQREVGQRMLARMEIMTLQPQTILDLGCGSGYFLRPLQNRYKPNTIYGLDHAAGMLEQVQQRYPEMKTLQAAASQIPLPDNSVDLVFSNLMLQWCTDILTVIKEVKRVLRPEGMFMFSCAGPDTLQELRDSWAQVDHYIHVNAFYDMHDIGDVMLQAKFADPVMDVDRFTMQYRHVRDVLLDLRKLGSRNVNAGRQQHLMGKAKFQAMQNAYESLRTADGYLPLSYEIIYGHAWCAADKKSSTSDAVSEVHIPVEMLKKK